jgi:cation diffusion facilitator family transporter
MSTQVAHTPYNKREITAAHLSIAGATFIFATSCIVGITCDSIALLLDAGTGLVILFMTFFARVAIKKLGSPPDHRFNFGYGKYEAFSVAMQNSCIIATCIIGIVFAVQDIVHPEDIVRYDLPAVATLLCGVLALTLGSYLRKISLIEDSSVLRASSTQWFVDAGLSFGMCAGFMFGIAAIRFGYQEIAPYIDPVMAIVLALLFMKLPLKMVVANVLELLDVAPEKDVHDRIKTVAERYKNHSCDLHRMRVRKAGKKTFLDVGFIVHGNLTVKETETIAENFERDLVNLVPGCDTIVYFKHKE